MSEFIITLPSLGDGAGEVAQVSFVYIAKGDDVKIDDDLVEMVTDKATFNVPSTRNGKITDIFVTEGDDVKVGDKICSVEIADE